MRAFGRDLFVGFSSRLQSQQESHSRLCCLVSIYTVYYIWSQNVRIKCDVWQWIRIQSSDWLLESQQTLFTPLFFKLSAQSATMSQFIDWKVLIEPQSGFFFLLWLKTKYLSLNSSVRKNKLRHKIFGYFVWLFLKTIFCHHESNESCFLNKHSEALTCAESFLT